LILTIDTDADIVDADAHGDTLWHFFSA